MPLVSATAVEFSTDTNKDFTAPRWGRKSAGFIGSKFDISPKWMGNHVIFRSCIALVLLAMAGTATLNTLATAIKGVFTNAATNLSTAT
jgi:hypothetical protein